MFLDQQPRNWPLPVGNPTAPNACVRLLFNALGLSKTMSQRLGSSKTMSQTESSLKIGDPDTRLEAQAVLVRAKIMRQFGSSCVRTLGGVHPKMTVWGMQDGCPKIPEGLPCDSYRILSFYVMPQEEELELRGDDTGN